MRKSLFSPVVTLALALLFISDIQGQVNRDGIPLIKTYNYSQTGGSEWNYSILEDSRGILYVGNETSGVLEFDGVRWHQIAINDNPVILALEQDDEGVVYVAGPYEFGYLEPNDAGELEYISLTNRLDSALAGKIGDVFDIQYFEGKIYYISKGNVFVYNRNDDSLGQLNVTENFYTLQRAYVLDGRLMIGDNRNGLTEMVGDSLVLMKGGEAFGRDYIFSVIEYDSTSFLVGTYFNGLHLYNHETGEVRTDFISVADNNLLKEKQIYNGIEMPDGKFAFGTREGLYFFDRSGRLTDILTNESAALYDDQMYAVYNNGDPVQTAQTWISVVENIYKVSYNLPFRVFGSHNNISYSINGLTKFGGDIYAFGDKGVAKRVVEDNKILYRDIPGLSTQVKTALSFELGSDRFLLAGALDGLYVIDRNDRVSLMVDILDKRNGEYNPGYIYAVERSEQYPERILVGYTRQLRILEYKGGRWRFNSEINSGLQGKVTSIVEESGERLWVGTSDQNKLYVLDFQPGDTTVTEYAGSELNGLMVNSVSKVNGEILLATSGGIFVYNSSSGSFEYHQRFNLDRQGVIYQEIVSLGENGVFISCFDYQNFDYIVKPDGSKIITPLYLMPKTSTSGVMMVDGSLWIPKSQQIFMIDFDRLDDYREDNEVLIRRVRIGQDSILFGGTFFELDEHGHKVIRKHQPKSQVPRISHSYNDITFNWSSTGKMAEDSTVYSFMIEGFDDDWSRWEKVYYKDYTNLSHGKYKFKIRARSITREVTEETVYEFEILRAWYQSLVAMFGYAVMIILVIVGIIKVYTRRLINENIRLEGIVAERTQEVVRQKEELEDSIHYASRIQRAILPSEKWLKDKVEEYFILFRPRDIVSGDFYWLSEKGPRLFIVAADCTGHGVPGAFMSILGISFLDEIINKTEHTKTDEILNQLRSHVTESLKQMEEGNEETKDGMDLGILVINFKEKEIEFSGAYNPCWVVRPLSKEEKELYLKGELEVDSNGLCNGEYMLDTIDADRMPIGISSRMGQPFTMHRQELKKGVSYYLFSDGYSDQFGGDSGRKFLKKNLKKLVLDIQGVPMKQQRDLLEKRLIDWMGEHDQVDDILIMGIKAI